jgi:hypothetical protein
MSAQTTVVRPMTYQERVRLMRAEAIVSWLAAAFDRFVEMLKIEPSAFEIDRAMARRRRWFGAFH